MRRRPYPPRPRRFGQTGGPEPSIPRVALRAVACLGAYRALNLPRLRRRLELTGLSWEELAPVLRTIRSIDDWAQRWQEEAQAHAAHGDPEGAAIRAFLGHLVLSPFHPKKAELLSLLRRFHDESRAARPDLLFERREIATAHGTFALCYERPRHPTGPAVALLPPLASVKEELTLFADPLLQAGFPVVRIDLPGQGESPPPLPVDAEAGALAALETLGIETFFAGGISLGAYFALRLAAAAPARALGVFGVSPPCIVTPEQWSRQPEVIWQYLDLYFATETRAETLRIGQEMTLDDILSRLLCPVLLYHARRDRISLPDAPQRYRAALQHLRLTDRIVPDRHGCLSHLPQIAAEAARWCREEVSSPRPAN